MSFALLFSFCINTKTYRTIFNVFTVFFISFLIIFYAYFDVDRLDSVPIGVESIFLMFSVIYYLYSQLSNISAQSIYEKFSFWIVIGILFYVGYSFFFNISSNSLNAALINKYYYYVFIGDIIKNVIFAVSIFYIPKPKQESSSSIPNLDMI